MAFGGSPRGKLRDRRRVVRPLLELEEGGVFAGDQQRVPGPLRCFKPEVRCARSNVVAGCQAAGIIECEDFELAADDHGRLGTAGMSVGPEVRARSSHDEESLHEIGGREMDVVMRPQSWAGAGASTELIKQTLCE